MHTHISLRLLSMSFCNACSSAVISCLQSSKNGSSLVNRRVILSICLNKGCDVSRQALNAYSCRKSSSRPVLHQDKRIMSSVSRMTNMMKPRICSPTKGRHTRSLRAQYLPGQRTRSQTHRCLSQQLDCAWHVSRQASPLISR